MKEGFAMLDSLNQRMNKMMPILTPLCLILGVFLEDIGHQLLFLIPYIFAFMTFSGSLSLNFKAFSSFTKYPFVILFTIAFLHVLMPLWAYMISTIFFDDHLLTIGYVLSVAIPTGISSFIWMTITRGHLALGLSIILIDTVLSPFILPFIMHLVVGKTIEIDTPALMLDLFLLIVVPSLAGMIFNEITNGNIEKTLGKKLAPFSKMSLFGIILINSSIIAPFVKNITWDVVHIILVVLVIAVSGYTLCLIFGHFLWKDASIVTSVVFTGGMRNIAMGVVIASTYFPAKVVMPVVFGMLFQQLLASLFSRILEKYKSKFV